MSTLTTLKVVLKSRAKFSLRIRVASLFIKDKLRSYFCLHSIVVVDKDKYICTKCNKLLRYF